MAKKTASPPGPADNLTDVPTMEDYKAALLETRPVLKGKKYLEMLRANYQSDDHTITPGELADAVDLPGFTQANTQYGNYAKALCKVLGRTPTFPVSVLVTFQPGDEPGVEFTRWTMIPQLVAALEDMGWVRPAQ